MNDSPSKKKPNDYWAVSGEGVTVLDIFKLFYLKKQKTFVKKSLWF